MKVTSISSNLQKKYYTSKNLKFKGQENTLKQLGQKLDKIDSLAGGEAMDLYQAEQMYMGVLKEIDSMTNPRDFLSDSLKVRTMHEMAYTQYKQGKFQEALKNQQQAVRILNTSMPESKIQERERKKQFLELYTDMGFVYSNLNINDLSELAYFKAYVTTQDLIKNDRELSSDQIMFLRERSNICLYNMNSSFENNGNTEGQTFCRLRWDDFHDIRKVQVDMRITSPKAESVANDFYEKMWNRSQKI